MEISIEALLNAIAGREGALVVLAIAVWAYATGRVRRADEVTERDKRIEILTRELDAERAARLAEQRFRREAMGELAVDLGEEAGPPFV